MTAATTVQARGLPANYLCGSHFCLYFHRHIGDNTPLTQTLRDEVTVEQQPQNDLPDDFNENESPWRPTDEFSPGETDLLPSDQNLPDSPDQPDQPDPTDQPPTDPDSESDPDPTDSIDETPDPAPPDPVEPDDAPEINTPSSFFLMVIPDFLGEKNKPFIYADCAVNIDPDSAQLAEIALASAASGAKLLGTEPRVALISFSTHGSAAHPRVDKVTQALATARQRSPQLAIDGEFQADTAIVPRVAAKKVKTESKVAGQANVLIFPDLDTGNAAYKLTQYMAQAQAIGPFLQGFAQPISDLSRGATVDDIVNTATITLAQT